MTITVSQCREDLERLLRVLVDDESVISERSTYDAAQFAHVVRRGIEAIDVQRVSTLQLRHQLKSAQAEMAADEKLRENARLRVELGKCQERLKIAEKNLLAMQNAAIALREELTRAKRPDVPLASIGLGRALSRENASLRETIREMRSDYHAQMEQIRALTERVHAYEGARYVHPEYFVPDGGCSLINPVAAPRRGKQAIGQGCTRAVPLRVRT